MDFNAASGYMLQRLERELKPELSYHCVSHTVDVLDATRLLSGLENISPQDQILLLTASLFHDAGMIVKYKDHESASVGLAEQTLPGLGYYKPQMDEIASLIMVTKLPQRPYNHFEQIICDADLDYLGRDDFFINSFKLKHEWQTNGIRTTTLQEWFEIQVKFLSEHQYFTKSAIRLRNAKKMQHLEEIRQLLS